MIIVENNQIYSIRDEITKKVYNVKKTDGLIKGNLVFKLEDNVISLIGNNTKIHEITHGILYEILKDILTNTRYQYKASIESIDIEESSLTIKIVIFRKIDLENDPFVVRNDFQLIRTTKNDNGVSRQFSYARTNIMDALLCIRTEDSIIVTNQNNQILGEINSKGMEYLNEHKGQNLYYKLINKTLNDSRNFIGTIRVYNILR